MAKKKTGTKPDKRDKRDKRIAELEAKLLLLEEKLQKQETQELTETIKKNEESELKKEKPNIPKGIDIAKHFGRNTKNGETRAVVMTPVASELSDHVRQNQPISETLKSCVHKPRG